MEIVVDEWLLEYMRPNTDLMKTSIAIQFINAVVKKCDKIVIGRSTPFVSKFHQYMGNFSWNTNFKKRFSKLNQLLFYNSDKTIIVDDSDMKELSKEIQEKTHHKDKYLIKLVYSSNNRIIVTTDQRLKEELQNEADLKIYLLKDFLVGYLSGK